ncbi:hypothetical protein LINPERHAP1_LOCUS37414, partial [Linum perenne]
DTVGRSIPSRSSEAGTGKSPSPTSIEKTTELLIFSPTRNTLLILVFILIVLIPTRLIELFGAIL